ncbi:MAG: hypothetical protein N2038_10105 [Geminicoccaceae bacterium]|nr:hypothetical protein [Geminicoccaceae bacterium]MCS7267067.1 hypothetical protein [Geminicoccaceae bacterium]MCX7630590.1 hypothetical protein [Geminicoccaceae bacterium]MDW8125447.1 hypothetical protein [Geminicoccaceae bacterium]MDW8342231.1 hypothetical protein [Geminicoccaceae bacterium]
MRPIRIVYVAHDVADGRVRNRCRQLLRLGCSLRLFGFHRGRGKGDPELRPVVLARAADRAFVHRVFAILAGILAFWRNREALRDADILMARNLEQAVVALAVACLARVRARFVYEVLDLHPLQTDAGPISALLRAVERLVLARTALLVVSSPWYVERFYRPRMGYRGPWFLLENKLPEEDVAVARERAKAARLPPRRPGRPWRILWLGYLRCERSFDILSGLAARRPDLVTVVIRGIPQGTVARELESRVRALPNVTYGGPYRHPDELGEICSSADLVWIVHYQGGLNARFAFANRMYDAICFHRPMLALEGTAIAEFVATHGAGWVLGEPVADNLERLLESLDEVRWRAVVDHIAHLPERVAVDTDDHARLLARLFPDRFARPGAATPSTELARTDQSAPSRASSRNFATW